MNRRPVIIDTDPGIDDAAALAAALFSDELDVKLLTTAAGNASLSNVTRNALCLLSFFGKNVPVAAGAEKPLVREFVSAEDVHGSGGMEGYHFPEPSGALLLNEKAINAMYRVIMQSKTPVTLVLIAPMTNAALLFRVYPEVKSRIREIVIMGGTAGRGNKGVLSEFNVATDPEAAKIVFGSGVPIVMAGLDVGWKALVFEEDSEKLKHMNQTGQMLYSLFRHYRGGSMKTGLKMYDSCAVAYLLCPGMFQIQKTFVDVELRGELTAGCTLVDLKGYLHKPNNAAVCLDLDRGRFIQWFMKSIEKCI
ncbi:MAG: ribonucleoside hydrolase RihC [Oscillospiraceae bacterium]|nr:ribonucleoside hydrolase RihC [Oscillospiraceae bacterium]MDD3260798.1 ribonucleoside hydrolase RihC [Oscillospiraceae bacterium]